MIIKFFIFLITISMFLHANINVVVSILPQKSFVKSIGGDKVNISVMVKPGNSPHTYEPKPSQMKDISKADLYFSIGVEFENSWLSKFQNQNQTMKIIALDKNILKNYISKNSLDPHIWTIPSNIKIIAKNILDNLILADKKDEKYYRTNYINFINHVDSIDTKIKKILKNTKPKSKFMVFHPSWGYFAKEYNLIQLPIEIDGKSPKPKDIVKIIKTAKKENIKAIVAAPEFSDKIAKQIAKELKINVIKISPLNPNWENNLLKLAKTIAYQ